jgi:predicted DNA-binding transcriptional regulator AlpA
MTNRPRLLDISPQVKNSTERLNAAAVEARLYSRTQAATYCGLSKQAFSAWVKTGRLPPPLIGTARWDRKAIDAALDRLSGTNANVEPSPLDQWRTSRARHS